MKIDVIGLFSFWVGGGFVGRHFSWALYLLDLLAIGLILFLCAAGIRYFIVLVKTRKRLKQLEAAVLQWRMQAQFLDGAISKMFVGEQLNDSNFGPMIEVLKN